MNDNFDVFLGFEKLKAGNSEPPQIADYPETVTATLRVFNKVWCPPPLMIPKKRQKSKYEQWIKELQTLENLCGTNSNFEIALRMATDVYQSKGYTFIVDSPLKLKGLIVTALAQISRKKQEETVIETKIEKRTNKKKTLQRIDILRESLTEDK